MANLDGLVLSRYRWVPSDRDVRTLLLRSLHFDLLKEEPDFTLAPSVVGVRERLSAEQAQRALHQRRDMFGLRLVHRREESLEFVEVDVGMRSVEPVLLVFARDRVSE
jgi:hypothetical protein